MINEIGLSEDELWFEWALMFEFYAWKVWWK